jgi:hypothetical protein
MTMTRTERERAQWLRVAFADVAGAGGEIDPADLEALPASFRPRVKRICEGAAVVFGTGDHQEALNLARDAISEIDAELPASWMPPSERPDAALIAEIRGPF